MRIQAVTGAAILALSVLFVSTVAQPASKAQGDDGGTLQPGDLGKTTIPVSRIDGRLPVAVRWWGQACVSIETFWGLSVVIDPFTPGERIGFPDPKLSADLVLITHEHGDHNAAQIVAGAPVVLRGLTADGRWAGVDHVLDRLPNAPDPKVVETAKAKTVSPHAVRVRAIGVYHDTEQGAKRGRNALFLIETNGLRILHCGDLGHTLTPEQARAVGRIDLLLLPIGGTYTIDAEAAVAVAAQLKPTQAIWPIHYNTGKGSLPLAPVDKFLARLPADRYTVRTVVGNTIALTARDAVSANRNDRPEVIHSETEPAPLDPDVEKAIAALRADRQALIDALGKVTDKQLNHKPSDGTHTIRWNFEHTTGRELGFFSQIYHSLDANVPVINWNPAQHPPQFTARHPEYTTPEMVRHVRRVAAFTERFSYLLAGKPADLKIEGTRFSVKSLSRLMVGHYRNHTVKAVKKFDLPDWPTD